MQVGFRNMLEPGELVRFLITTNIMMYLTALAWEPAGINMRLNPMVFLSPDIRILFTMGAAGWLPLLTEDRWWTVITANYLHGSLLHLIFNVTAGSPGKL